MTWVRQYSVLNVVGARKLKALIFYTINPLLYEKRLLCVFEPLFGGSGATYARERNFQGAKVSWSELARVLLELLLQGENSPKSEKARY